MSSPFGQNITSGGFGALTSTVLAKFGQSGFGFGSAGQQEAGQPTIGQSAGASEPSTNTQEDGMAEDGLILDGLGLSSSNNQDADSKPSIFGNTTTHTSSTFQLTGELVKSGTGFGTLGNLDDKSPFANPSAFVTNATSAFGEARLVLNRLSPPRLDKQALVRRRSPPSAKGPLVSLHLASQLLGSQRLANRRLGNQASDRHNKQNRYLARHRLV